MISKCHKLDDIFKSEGKKNVQKRLTIYMRMIIETKKEVQPLCCLIRWWDKFKSVDKVKLD